MLSDSKFPVGEFDESLGHFRVQVEG
jgi:hypothetical protein